MLDEYQELRTNIVFQIHMTLSPTELAIASEFLRATKPKFDLRSSQHHIIAFLQACVNAYMKKCDIPTISQVKVRQNPHILDLKMSMDDEKKHQGRFIEHAMMELERTMGQPSFEVKAKNDNLDDLALLRTDILFYSKF